MRPARVGVNARAPLLVFAACSTLAIFAESALALHAGDESSCRGVLGDDSACCDKLEWLTASPNAAPSDCVPGGGTVLECLLLATGKRLPYDTGLYNLCQNTVSANVSAAHFLVRRQQPAQTLSFSVVLLVLRNSAAAVP